MLEGVLTIPFNSVQTLSVGVLLLLFGNWVNTKVKFFTKYCIPGAVVGGLTFCILAFILRQAHILQFKITDGGLQQLFMNLFFTASGFGASMMLLKKGGKLVVIFLVLAAALAFVQNAVSVGMGVVLSSIGIPIQPMLALMTGSIPLTGGHGNSAAFGPVAVQMGFPSALSISVAAATFGLVTGCLMGGPVANSLILKKGLMNKASKDVAVSEADLKVRDGSVKELGQSFFLIIVALGFGSILFEVFKVLMPKVTLPIHVMGMLAGVLFRIAMDVKKIDVPEDTIDKLSNVFLGIFVSMAVYTMKLWELIDLALPIIIILLIQLVVIWAFVRFLTFPLMGGDYDAAVICAGHIGFGLGAVPVSMANMNSVCSKFRYSKLAYFVVPIIGALFSNFTNAAIITMWMNWCK